VCICVHLWLIGFFLCVLCDLCGDCFFFFRPPTNDERRPRSNSRVRQPSSVCRPLLPLTPNT
jgi:hypothetical protein